MIDEARLDPRVLGAVDRRDSLRALALAGADVRRSRVLADEAGIARVNGGDRPRSLLVASLGGAGVVGDVVDFLAEPGSPVAVMQRRNAPLPGWVGPLDLVVAVSQSGVAPGPVALAAEAGRRGAGLLTVGAADSPLADVCARARGIHVDPGVSGRTTRTSLWSLLTPVLLGLEAVGVIGPVGEALEEVADTLDARAEEYRPDSEVFVNPAKDLAVALSDTVPVVLGDGPLTGVAAARAAAQLARTARTPASCGELPDAASQIVATFDGPFARPVTVSARDDVFADPYLDGPSGPRLGLLMLRDRLPEQVTEAEASRHNLAQAVVDSATESGVRVWEHSTTEGEPLARLAGLLALVDYTATYLALGLGHDPAGSAHVAELRDRTR